MDTVRLYELIEDPSLLNGETLSGLKKLTEEYPYFQTARILYLKNLSLLDDHNFGEELKKTAIFIADRKKLFSFIEGSRFGLLPEPGEDALQDTSDTFALIDSFLGNDEPSDEAVVEAPILFHTTASTDYLHWTISNKTEEEEVEKEETPKLQHQDLIDSFIQEDEQRTPGRGIRLDDDTDYIDDYYPEDIGTSEDSSKTSDDDSYFTETLARIYVKQKRYDKALQIIKSLSLKYPEKNVYFADQIRFLEKLIINNVK